MGPAVRTGILAATLLAGAVALGLAHAPRPGARVRSSGASASVQVRESSPAAPAIGLQAPPPPAGASTLARSEPFAAPEVDRLTRLCTLVERLARRLRSEPFHEPTWDTTLAASARPFEPAVLAALGARQVELSDDEALVLGGLLCARHEIDREAGRAAPEALLERWRSSLEGEGATDPVAAALGLRSLAALGSSTDARRLLSLATAEADENSLARPARRALRHAGEACVPRALAELTDRAPASDAASWALPLLASLGQRATWRFEASVRDEVAERLALLLDDERRGAGEQALAAGALAAWSPREALLRLGSAPRGRPLGEPERVLLRSLAATPRADEALGLLVERLDDPADAAQALELAEDLAFLPGGRAPGSPWSGVLVSALEGAALESPDPALRRRALRSLCGLPATLTSPAVRALAEDDVDPSVRALASRLASSASSF